MCLDGALQAEWESVQEELSNVDTTHESLAKTAVGEIADRMDQVRDRFLASAVTFTFAADGLSWGEYLRLQAEHAPREGNTLDRIRGFNVETFYPALIRKTCVSVSAPDGEPEDVPDDVWDTLLGDGDKRGSLNLTQVNKLISGADYVMNGETAVPPSARSLLTSQDFGASLVQPSPGQAEAPSGSEGGKRPTSPSTSTTKKARSKESSSGR
jgi:hypothetical protein